MPGLATGSTFAGYRIEQVAGRGGMGVVYRATDAALERPVALKLIAPWLADDPEFRRRFESESKTAASLDHPNVIPIYQAGEHEGELFLVMRYVDGRDLRGLLAEEGRLAPQRAARVIRDVASALDAAHAAGLVHRDVKPANVLLSATEHVYLTDFGLSKRALAEAEATQSGRLLGTLNYVAPEQIRGAELGPATDVYALGCVLFLLLTGRVPFPIDTEEGKLWAHLSTPPPAPSQLVPEVPAPFDRVIARAMSKQPADRFRTAGELAEAATAALTEPPGGRRPSPAAALGRALVNPFSLALLAGTFAAGVVIGAVPIVAGVALLVYAASVWLAYSETVREPAPAPADNPGASPVAELVEEVLEKEADLRQEIDHAELGEDEVPLELERFRRVVRRAATRAEIVHQDLDDGADDGDTARRRMEEQLKQFYHQMGSMLADLERMRAQLHGSHDRTALVEGMRDLREEIADVDEGLAAMNEEAEGYPWMNE